MESSFEGSLRISYICSERPSFVRPRSSEPLLLLSGNIAKLIATCYLWRLLLCISTFVDSHTLSSERCWSLLATGSTPPLPYHGPHFLQLIINNNRQVCTMFTSVNIASMAFAGLLLLAGNASALPHGPNASSLVRRLESGDAQIRARRHWRHHGGDHEGCKYHPQAGSNQTQVPDSDTPNDNSTIVPVATPSPDSAITSTSSSVVADATAALSSASDATQAESTPSMTLNLQQAAVVATPTPSPAASSASGDEQTYLDMHNAFRAKYGESPRLLERLTLTCSSHGADAPDLVWNDTLASYASDWASKCGFKHSDGPNGENLAASYGLEDVVGSGITGWQNEASTYKWDNPGFNKTTGHFTQMVWKATTQLGCAKTTCGANTLFPADSYPDQDFVVSPHVRNVRERHSLTRVVWCAGL